MTLENKKIFVTNALPYTNRPIHISHMVSYIQTIFGHRFQRMQGHDVVFICASDAHGTPIMLSAEDLGVEPVEVAAEYTRQHENDFNDFHVSFDNYHTTHSEENEELVERCQRLKENDCIRTEVIEQPMMIRKICFFLIVTSEVHAPNAMPLINMETIVKCGATYKPTDLLIRSPPYLEKHRV